GYANTLTAFASPHPGKVFNANASALAVAGIAHLGLEEFLAKHVKGPVSRPIADEKVGPLNTERFAIFKAELGPLESELRAFAADASSFADDADAARTKVTKGELSPSDAIMSLSEGA